MPFTASSRAATISAIGGNGGDTIITRCRRR
jgi:hypothetical protein